MPCEHITMNTINMAKAVRCTALELIFRDVMVPGREGGQASGRARLSEDKEVPGVCRKRRARFVDGGNKDALVFEPTQRHSQRCMNGTVNPFSPRSSKRNVSLEEARM